MIKKYLNIKRLAKGIVLAGIIFLTTTPLFANKFSTASKTSAPAVQLISSGEQGTMLSVQFNNDSLVNFTVIIKDEAGNLLYRKGFETENFSKTFQLVNESLDYVGKLTLTVAVEGGSNYSYDVNTNYEVTRKIEIIKP